MHDLAVTYHFQSPWENHHLAASLRLLLKPEHAFLSVSCHTCHTNDQWHTSQLALKYMPSADRSCCCLASLTCCSNQSNETLLQVLQHQAQVETRLHRVLLTLAVLVSRLRHGLCKQHVRHCIVRIHCVASHSPHLLTQQHCCISQLDVAA